MKFTAFFVSWRAVLYFSSYIFLIWFYSHKLKKYPIIGNLSAALLAVLPFFAVLLYFKNFYHVVFFHAFFLYLLLLIKEMTKDLANITGDMANNYSTIPVKFGETISKKIITALICCTLIPIYFLIEIYDVGYMDSYFYLSMIVLIIFINLLWKSNSKPHYIKLHTILKFLIVAGVFSIVLINPQVLVHGKQVLKLQY